jgi:hypothetical protein
VNAPGRCRPFSKTAAALEEFNKATVHLRGSIEQLNQEIASFKV